MKGTRVFGEVYLCDNLHCDNTFTARNAEHRFCSPACRLRAWKAKHPRLSPPGTTRRRPSREHRADVYLTAEQRSWLKKESERRGESQSAIIRRIIDKEKKT